MPYRRFHPESHALAIAAAGMGVWDWNVLEDELLLDDHLFALYGLIREDCTGTLADWKSILHPQSREDTEARLASIMGQTDEFSTSYQILRPIDGREGWLNSAGRVIRNERGEVVRMIGISWDRTDQVKMEKEVARAYDFIDGLINSISDPIFVKDSSHRWVFFNDAFTRLIGKGREQLLGKTDHEFFPKEMADHFWKMDDEVLRQRREIEVEEPVVGADGLTRFLLTKKVPILDVETQEQLLVGVIRDITERRREEQELRSLQQLVESSNDLFAAFGLDLSEAVYSNRAAREICGLAPGGRALSDLVSPPQANLVFGEACERARAGGHWQGQLELITLSGEAIPVSASIFGILGKDSKVTTIALLAKDISEQVKSQRLLLEQSKMAALGQLAGGIAHEINNPLAAVRGRLYLMRLAIEGSNQAPDPKALLEEIQTVDRLTVRISEIVNALKVFSRKDSGSRLSWLSLADVVREVISVSSEKLCACDAALEVKVSPTLLVHARRVDLMQILVNLINNSCDAVALSGERWIKLEARIERGMAQLSVTDSGRGIPGEVAKRMMEPFYTTKEVGQGTGLGLSISRSLAENMGGSLEYDATFPNTRFLMRLTGR
jgi:PAS domain S-box-containing protein